MLTDLGGEVEVLEARVDLRRDLERVVTLADRGERAHHLDDGQVRHALPESDARALDEREAERPRHREELGDESRLADPRLALDSDQLSVTLLRGREPALDDGELDGAPHERREPAVRLDVEARYAAHAMPPGADRLRVDPPAKEGGGGVAEEQPRRKLEGTLARQHPAVDLFFVREAIDVEQ